jgi:hypothetical protein
VDLENSNRLRALWPEIQPARTAHCAVRITSKFSRAAARQIPCAVAVRLAELESICCSPAVLQQIHNANHAKYVVLASTLPLHAGAQMTRSAMCVLLVGLECMRPGHAVFFKIPFVCHVLVATLGSTWKLHAQQGVRQFAVNALNATRANSWSSRALETQIQNVLDVMSVVLERIK